MVQKLVKDLKIFKQKRYPIQKPYGKGLQLIVFTSYNSLFWFWQTVKVRVFTQKFVFTVVGRIRIAPKLAWKEVEIIQFNWTRAYYNRLTPKSEFSYLKTTIGQNQENFR